jgi:hypothetical protein
VGQFSIVPHSVFFPDDFALVPMEMNNLLAQAVDPRLFS